MLCFVSACPGLTGYGAVLNSENLPCAGGCWEFPAAHDQSNQELTGVEPGSEREFGCRVEDTAHTPNFWA